MYAFVRFGIGEALHHLTVHRGMFHSIPAAILFGELAFLLSSGDPVVRCYKAAAVVIGYLSHLLLDELYSMPGFSGQLGFKKSYGTAMKLYGRHGWANVIAYAALALVTFVAHQEAGATSVRTAPRPERTASDWSEKVKEHADPAALNARTTMIEHESTRVHDSPNSQPAAGRQAPQPLESPRNARTLSRPPR